MANNRIVLWDEADAPTASKNVGVDQIHRFPNYPSQPFCPKKAAISKLLASQSEERDRPAINQPAVKMGQANF
jgi:hypothetical protein